MTAATVTNVPARVIRQLLWAYSDDGQECDLDAALTILTHESPGSTTEARQRALSRAGSFARALYLVRVLRGAGLIVTLHDLLRHRRVIVCVEGGREAIIDDWMLRGWVTEGQPHPHTAVALLSAEAEPQFD